MGLRPREDMENAGGLTGEIFVQVCSGLVCTHGPGQFWAYLKHPKTSKKYQNIVIHYMNHDDRISGGGLPKWRN